MHEKKLFLFLMILIMSIPSCGHIRKFPFHEPLKIESSLEKKAVRSHREVQPPAKKKGNLPPAQLGKQAKLTVLQPFSPPSSNPKVREEVPFNKEEIVQISVNEMPMIDFVHYIFGEVFGVNYIVDDKIRKVKQTVTLNFKEGISTYRLFQIVRGILCDNKIYIYMEDGVFNISYKTGEETAVVGVGSSLESIPAYSGKILQIVPIRYVRSSELVMLLKKMLKINAWSNLKGSTIYLEGYRPKIIKAIQALAAFDRPTFSGYSIGILRLEYWLPGDFIEEITKLLRQEGIPISDHPGQPGVLFVPLLQGNKVIVFAPSRDILSRVDYWSRQIDVPDIGIEKQYYIYYPQNRKADELGETLKNILSFGTDGSYAVPFEKTKKAQEGKKLSPGKQNSKSLPIRGSAEDIKFVVDKSQNALIIWTSPQKYGEILSLLRRLDRMPPQVTLEATIAEITLKGDLQFGVEWYFKHSGKYQGVLRTLGQLGIGTAGVTYSLVKTTGKFAAFLNALAKENLVRILSSPRLTVKDGESASINVGTEVPVITGEITSSESGVPSETTLTRAVEYRSTGVILHVTPTVNARGVVSLALSLEVSAAQTNTTSDINSPLILNRSLSTQVITSDGQMVMLGGLIKTNESNTTTGVPFLKSIPYLGRFFSVESTAHEKTELLVMITPKIVRSYEDIEEMRKVINDTYDMLEIEGDLPPP